MTKSKKIGWSCWAPGLTSKDHSSSAGTGLWVRSMLDMFIDQGHEVLWLLDDTLDAPEGTRLAAPEECDIIFMNWRWQLPEKYKERNNLYYQQMEILNRVAGRVPIVVHDQDHKISDKDLKHLQSFNRSIRLTAPEFFPRDGFKTLHYTNAYGSQLMEDKMPFLTFYALMYVGNVYERYDQAVKFIAPFSEMFHTKVFGNWLEKGPDRPGPTKVRDDFPNVEFAGRIKQTSIIPNFLETTTTIHLHKPSYGETGFITMRWFEAAAAGIMAFIPDTFRLPGTWSETLQQLGAVVSDGEQMRSTYYNMPEEYWFKIVEIERELINMIHVDAKIEWNKLVKEFSA